MKDQSPTEQLDSALRHLDEVHGGPLRIGTALVMMRFGLADQQKAEKLAKELREVRK